MSDFRFEWQDTQDGNRLAVAQSLAKSKTPRFEDAIYAAAETVSLTKSMFDAADGQDYFDPDYRMDPEWLRQQAASRGISDEYLASLEGAVSERHAIQLLDRTKQELEARNTLSQAGWTGVAATLLVGMLDPMTLAATMVPSGQVAWASKAGLLKSAIKAGLVGGGSNAAVEAALAATHLTSDPEDIFLASVVGFGLGTTVGAFTGLATKNAQNLLHRTLLRRVGAVEPERIAPGLTPTLTAEAPQVALRQPHWADPSIPAVERPLTGAEARQQALSKYRDAFTKELEAEVGEVAPTRLREMRKEALKAIDENNKWLGTFGRVPGHQAQEAAVAKAQKLLKDLDVVDRALRAADDLDWLKKGFVPARFDKAVTAEADALLSMGNKPKLKAAVRDMFREPSMADDPLPFKPRQQFQAKAYAPLANRSDLVEWDGRNGAVERGRVIHEDKTRTLIEDERGQVREFKASEVDADEEGAKFLGGSIGSAQIGDITEPASKMTHIRLGKWKIPLRFDAFSYFENTGNNSMRRLAGLLLDDPLGKQSTKGADGKTITIANRVAASEYAEVEFKRLIGPTIRAFDSAFAEYAKRAGLTAAQRLTHQAGFANLISRVTRDATGELARAHPEAAKAAREMVAARTTALKKMQQYGVEGADEVAENANYLNRRWKWDKLRLLMAEEGTRPQVIRLFAESIRKMHPELEDAKAKSLAKTIVERMRDLQTDPKNLGFLSDDGFDRLAAALRMSGMEDEYIDDVLGFVFQQKTVNKGDDAAHPRLKKRMLLDEDHSVSWTDENGAARTLRIDDLFENDVRMLNQIYFRQTGGLIGMAKNGIRSKTDYHTLREAARREDDLAGVASEKTNRRLENMDRVVRHILGQPMYEGFGSTANRALRILRNANVAMNLAQVGFAQVAEAGQLLGMKTAMALRTNMTAYDSVLNKLQRGKPDSDLLRDLRAMCNVAEEASINKAGWKDYEPAEAALGRAEDISALTSGAVLKFSGMHALTEFQRDKIAKMYTQRLMNIAVGAEKLDDGLRVRLATNGLEEGDDLNSVLGALKKYAQMSEDGRSVVGIDYTAWEHASPKTFDSFNLAVFRESHRSIQEVSIGAAPLWMHSEFGKLMFQFRSFVMNAWTKQSLYGFAHMDMQAAATWVFSMMFGSLAYAAQQSLNYANNKEELDRRLGMREIALAGFQRAGFSSLVPMAIDSTWGFLTGDNVFKFGRSSNLASGFILGNPTMSLATKILGAASAGAQDVFTDDHLWTQKEFGYAAGLLPQIVFLRTFIDTYKQEFPKRNYLREGQQ